MLGLFKKRTRWINICQEILKNTRHCLGLEGRTHQLHVGWGKWSKACGLLLREESLKLKMAKNRCVVQAGKT